MEATSLLFHDIKLILVIMAFLVSTNITNSMATSPYRLDIKLIHRDSNLSPLYNATATIADLANQSLERSLARLSYLKAATMVEAPERIRGAMFAGTGSFLVSMLIGEPNVHQFVWMDTGSSLLWVHCIPCTGCNTNNPIFNPSLSSTYYPIPCDHDPYCAAHCDHQRNWCTYSEYYADGASTSGNYAEEKLTFRIQNEGITTAPVILFGCGRVMNEPNREISGVMGLGSVKESLASQLGTKFSYCIGNIREQIYEHNRLIIGNGAALLGASTPLDMYNDLYYVTLESISIGGIPLTIAPRVFQRTTHGGGVIIDSGTEWTFLIRGAYVVVRNTVERIIGRALPRWIVPNHLTAVCYYGSVVRDLSTFPILRFHFRGGAVLEVPKENLFKSFGNDKFCLTVILANGNTPGDVNIIDNPPPPPPSRNAAAASIVFLWHIYHCAGTIFNHIPCIRTGQENEGCSRLANSHHLLTAVVKKP
ncbi:hypothetical protein RJ640_027112 [Escallonia rubra]|uniref:Peptidase A1 domain-containing protein n=1 Tax=Escallonia rubra TaxID=112253 RepID=A0AA88R5H7_9ASTE|nr:hypothetical protein RJ640_027112 [Escallonia rubra]